MEPEDVLKQLVKDIEGKKEVPVSYNELEKYFQLLVSSTCLATVTNNIFWDVGVTLLLISDNDQHELFNRFGYPIIAETLYTTIVSGYFPQGLQWFTSGFLPGDVEGDIMLAVLSNSTVENAIRKGISKGGFSINMDNLNPSDVNLGTATVLFLANLHRFGLDRRDQLHWAARLIDHFSDNNSARYQALKLVLEGLIKTNRFINSFYWLQKFFIDDKDHLLSDNIFHVLTEVVKILRESDDGGKEILSNLSFQNDFIFMVMTNEKAQLYATFLALWLQFNSGHRVHKDLVEIGTGLLWGKYPTLSLFISKISNWISIINNSANDSEKKSISITEMVNSIEQKEDLLNDIKDNFQQPPNYRGRGLPVELWSSCRDQVFLPLIQRLEEAKTITHLEIIGDEVNQLDAGEIVRDSDIYKFAHSKSRKLKSDELRMLTNDFQNYIDDLTVLTKACIHAFYLEGFVHEVESEIDWSTLHRECDELIDQIPSLEEAITSYFFPILDTWESVLEKK